MRSKEDALDYRYFPEPDLPELVLNEEYLETIKVNLVESSFSRIKKYKDY
jgi:aspartyl-tRNA(Asn)/glutamyl-tRNA(Gln) amidotransferase subunit B